MSFTAAEIREDIEAGNPNRNNEILEDLIEMTVRRGAKPAAAFDYSRDDGHPS